MNTPTSTALAENRPSQAPRPAEPPTAPAAARHEREPCSLRSLGLESCKQAKAAQGWSIKNQRGKRDILKITTEHGETVFLKRVYYSDPKNARRSFYKRRCVWSLCRQEFENYQMLRRAGIGTARPVGFGEQVGWLSERFSYIVTEAARGETLDDRLRRTSGAPQRRQLLMAAGRFIRRLHDAGFAFPDLMLRHIYVDGDLDDSSKQLSFSLIDVARLDQSAETSVKLRARDFAVMHNAAPASLITARDRVWLLQGYGWHDFPKLVRLARREATRLRNRRRRKDD